MSEMIDEETWLLFLTSCMSDQVAWEALVTRLAESTGLVREKTIIFLEALYEWLTKRQPTH